MSTTTRFHGEIRDMRNVVSGAMVVTLKAAPKARQPSLSQTLHLVIPSVPITYCLMRQLRGILSRQSICGQTSRRLPVTQYKRKIQSNLSNSNILGQYKFVLYMGSSSHRG